LNHDHNIYADALTTTLHSGAYAFERKANKLLVQTLTNSVIVLISQANMNRA